MDNLEKFIFENRESFDDAIPSLKVWASIDRAANKREARRIKLWKQMRVAAAVVALLIAGGVAGSYITQSSQANDAVAILQESSPEYFEMEQFFQQQIDDRVGQLTAYNPNDPVLEDLQQIDTAMKELKEELINAPKGNEEEIIENLIQNYQMKIAILERVLERIEFNSNTQKSKTEDDEIII